LYDRPSVAPPCLPLPGRGNSPASRAPYHHKADVVDGRLAPAGFTPEEGSLAIGILLRAHGRARVHAWGASDATTVYSSLVERSRTERLGLADLSWLAKLGRDLRTGLRSKRSTTVPCASAKVALECRLLPNRVIGLIGRSVGRRVGVSVGLSIIERKWELWSCGVVELGTRGDVFRHNRAVYGLPYINSA
jgi:hypothetical protein